MCAALEAIYRDCATKQEGASPFFFFNFFFHVWRVQFHQCGNQNRRSKVGLDGDLSVYLLPLKKKKAKTEDLGTVV